MHCIGRLGLKTQCFWFHAPRRYCRSGPYSLDNTRKNMGGCGGGEEGKVESSSFHRWGNQGPGTWSVPKVIQGTTNSTYIPSSLIAKPSLLPRSWAGAGVSSANMICFFFCSTDSDDVAWARSYASEMDTNAGEVEENGFKVKSTGKQHHRNGNVYKKKLSQKRNWYFRMQQ